MIFLDINTFYGPNAGGIRTYHQAKTKYFLNHPDHSCFLVFPGPVHTVEHIGKNVIQVQFYGKQMSRDPKGYRFLLDYPGIYKLIKKVRPDIVEAGDPYVTGLLTLYAPFLPKTTIRSAFYHSDPIDTYLKPWFYKHKIIFRKQISEMVDKLFFSQQKKFDATMVASRLMEKKLRHRGMTQTHYVPFGNDPLMLKAFEKRKGDVGPGKVRLLYGGRLDQEKGVDMLLKIIPELLTNRKLVLSVAGHGQYDAEFAAIKHPRYRFLGYVSSRRKLADIFSKHDIFLATGKHETFSLAVLEALASGQVVVGPDQGGVGEMLQQCGSSFIFKAENHHSLLKTILAACSCDLAAESLAANACAQKLGSWNEAIENMIHVYQQLFAAKKQYVAGK
jgi:alpha-1,6-mannosyltransferase